MIDSLLEKLSLRPELEAELRLGGGATGLALRVAGLDAGRAETVLELVRLPAALRRLDRPNELPPAVARAVETLAVFTGGVVSGDDALVLSDWLELPLFSESLVEGRTFAHWVGPW